MGQNGGNAAKELGEQRRNQIVGIVARHWWQNGIWPNASEIQKELGVSLRATCKHIEKLRLAGVVDKKYGKLGRVRLK